MTGPSGQDEVFAFLGSLTEAAGAPLRIDTHANAVFLGGTRAYKVKRAVKFPFLDYSTLALREEACKREISYNSRYAPDIYLEAMPITRETSGRLALNGTGAPEEWTVVMNRFDDSQQLDLLASAAPLSQDLCDKLARMMVEAHKSAPVLSEKASSFLAELQSYTEQNEAAWAEHPELFPPAQASRLTAISRNWLERAGDLILKRGAAGLVRLCHGDAHARNIALIGKKPVLFDAIEFSDAIATTDVLYDLAFLLMDLCTRNQKAAANRIFNRYLDQARSADLDGPNLPEGLAALPFYLSMRAAIRAKIAASAAANQQDDALRESQQADARSYFAHALAFLDPDMPELLGIGGLSGTGKSRLAYGLAPELGRAPGARILRTDVERKARFGLEETEKAPAEAYTQEASDAVYSALDHRARTLLASGHSVIFDAVLSKPAEREKLQSIAAACEAKFTGLWLEAGDHILKDRVSQRKGDASDATPEVIDKQKTYDIGDLGGWIRIDASGTPEQTRALAEQALSSQTPK
ncbi:AAA family ATPase [Roseibium litorale]|uniref:AAA family ATPase n=1 Tax=Roseibium litorale TaxID=2803841 RepID=A0ABR9CRL7_9HYPH|nr:bifunctional aminoglycoside phosphotransferase/ATP-binding protein [Roseibium litorale]MBD8892901.1 AAA family ATPase [Roseibium litorale]